MEKQILVFFTFTAVVMLFVMLKTKEISYKRHIRPFFRLNYIGCYRQDASSEYSKMKKTKGSLKTNK